jgi:hypothetical protein
LMSCSFSIMKTALSLSDVAYVLIVGR